MTLDTTATRPDVLHALLAGWLVRRGDEAPSQAVADHGVDALLAACEREGVVSLVHARLSEAAALPHVPLELLEPLAARARHCAARSLLCVSEARRIQKALDAAGLPALWLKGIALGQWLYASPHLRDTADIDLLLPDHATTLRAAAVLKPLGYALPNPHIAGNLVVHELLAWSERAQLELDLHWDLSNDALFANKFEWISLSEASMSLPGLGTARGLSPAHAFLHACMHRALNHLTGRHNRLRWLYDIHLIWEGMTDSARSVVTGEGIEHGIAEPVLSALLAAREVFGTAVEGSDLRRLTSAAAQETVRSVRLSSWPYFQLATLAMLPPAAKFRWARQALFPDMAHLRVRYGFDGARAWLILARRGIDAWNRMRRYLWKSRVPH